MNIRSTLNRLSPLKKQLVLVVVSALLTVMALPAFAYDNTVMVGPDAQLFIEEGNLSRMLMTSGISRFTSPPTRSPR